MREINLYSGKIIRNDKDQPIEEGMESEIFLYSNPTYYDRNVVLKKLRPWKEFLDNGINILGDYDENKRKKIEIIKDMPCFKDEVQILDAVTEFRNFIGYTMEICPYPRLDVFSDRETKIECLKLIREKIRRLNDSGVFVGDFNSNNFLVNKNNNEVVMCDLDNFKIGDLDFDIKHKFIQEFYSKCSKEDYVDSYALNLFTLALLTESRNAYVLQHLSEFSLPEELDTKENRDVLDSMNNLDDSYQPRFLIDNLK